MIKCDCGEKKEMFAVSCRMCGHVNETQVAVIFLVSIILLGVFVFMFVPFE